MLDTLDQIRWDSLYHRKGIATDLPHLLRKISEGDLQALTELESRILFQSSIFSATPAVIPFLIEMAKTRIEIAILVAKCCRSVLWTKSNSPEGKISEKIIDALNDTLPILLSEISTISNAQIPGYGVMLNYGSDRELIAEKIGDTLKTRQDLNEKSRVVLTLAMRDAMGIHISDAESKTFEAFVCRMSQASNGMPKYEVDALIFDLQDATKVAKLNSILVEFDDAFGSLGELLLSSIPEIRLRLIPSIIHLFLNLSDPSQTWKMSIVLLHLVFESTLNEEITSLQFLVLKAFLDHPILWKMERFSKDISDHLGKSWTTKKELEHYLNRQSKPVIALIMTPNESPLVQATLQKMGRPEWLNTPWLLFSGDTSLLEIQISENPSYFTEEIMAGAYQVASAMISNIAYEIDPSIESFRFYPSLDTMTLENICKANGWKIHRPPKWAASLREISYAEFLTKNETLDKGLIWKTLEKNIRKEIEICVSFITSALWGEAEAWHMQVKRSKIPIAPLMFAKYKDNLELTFSYWPYDRTQAKRTGVQSGRRYILLAVEDFASNDLTQIRIYFGNNLLLTLKIIRKYQDMLVESKEVLQRFLQELLLNIEDVSLEFENGVIQALSLQKYDA